jgi:miniconductance mechanosensitive channel
MAAASRAMAIADELYSSRPEVNRPGALRGYRQVGMVVIGFVGGISAAALAVGKSPLVFLAALGAVAAVIGVVFKDVLFSLVANIMLTANDAIRVGDWVEMKQHSIDGRVGPYDLSVNIGGCP